MRSNVRLSGQSVFCRRHQRSGSFTMKCGTLRDPLASSMIRLRFRNSRQRYARNEKLWRRCPLQELRSMHLSRALLSIACLSLAGCVFGYYEAAPADSRGDFVVNSEGAGLAPCDLGPGMRGGSTPGTCIFTGSRICNGCVVLPAGTPVKVLHVFVNDATRDVSLEVGTGANRKVVHAYRNWAQVRQILIRP